MQNAIFIDLKHHPEETWPLPIPAALQASDRNGHLVFVGIRELVMEAACRQIPRKSAWGVRDAKHSDQRGLGQRVTDLLGASDRSGGAHPQGLIPAGEIPIFVTDTPTLPALALISFVWACWKEQRLIGVMPETDDKTARVRHHGRLKRLHMLASGGPSGLDGLDIPRHIHLLYERESRLRLETCLEALEAWIDMDVRRGIDTMTRRPFETIAAHSYAGEACGTDLYACTLQWTAKR